MIDTVHDQNIRKQGGDGQAVLNYISDEVFDNIKGNEMIEQIAYTKAVSYHINNPGLEKWRADMWFMDDTALKFARYEPTTGHRPEAENSSSLLRITSILSLEIATAKMTFPLLLLKQLSKIRHLMRVASYILQRFWKKHFLSRMELPQIITKTLREILWFNYMEQMIFY